MKAVTFGFNESYEFEVSNADTIFKSVDEYVSLIKSISTIATGIGCDEIAQMVNGIEFKFIKKGTTIEIADNMAIAKVKCPFNAIQMYMPLNSIQRHIRELPRKYVICDKVMTLMGLLQTLLIGLETGEFGKVLYFNIAE
jgi:hypothetical protein